VQGVGGGGLAPVAQAILVDTFPPAKRAAAFALFTVVIVTAPAVGPVLGGWITDNYDWRWIFFINVPVGILSLYLSNKLIHDPKTFTEERLAAKAAGQMSIDTVGIILIGLASAALEVSLDRGQIDDWFGSAFITSMIVTAVLGWIGTVAWESYVNNPIIDFSLLKNRNFAIASMLFFVFGIGLFGSTATGRSTQGSSSARVPWSSLCLLRFQLNCSRDRWLPQRLSSSPACALSLYQCSSIA
jgi:DHA2 family multidrug resistance protein